MEGDSFLVASMNLLHSMLLVSQQDPFFYVQSWGAKQLRIFHQSAY